MEKEQWRPVTTHPGIYEVSNFGRVRSVSRTYSVCPSGRRKYQRRLKGRILCHETRRHNVTLWYEFESRQVCVHILVLEAFVGPRPLGMYGCHRDDDPSNNKLCNLYWGTPTENSADKIRHGNQPRGEQIAWHILNESDIRRIRYLCRTHTQSEVGHLYGLKQSYICKIVNGYIWSHV